MNLPEQIRRPSDPHDSWPPLPRVGQQSKRESRLSSASSTNASASRRQWDRAQRPRHAPHPQIVSSRNRLVRPLPIAAETLDSGWRLSQSHTLPSISRVVPQSCPPLRLRHESTPFGLSSAQKLLIHGAAGGVGSFAVQLAKWKGAYVIGTASTRNQAFLRQLGETLDSGWRLSQSHTLPSISRVVPQSCPPLRLRHESTPFGLSSAQQC